MTVWLTERVSTPHRMLSPELRFPEALPHIAPGGERTRADGSTA
jgi:hypothetical protein